jgi:hypothetical protein
MAQDKTRELALFSQRGVKDCQLWTWGPFKAARIVIPGNASAPSCTTYAPHFGVWAYGLTGEFTVTGAE